MNRTFCSLILSLGLGLATTGLLRAADTYEVDAKHSSVIFKIKHAGASHFYGMLGVKSGSISFDEADPTKSSVELIVDPAAVQSGIAKRDEHLKSPDFFNVKEFPEITFKSSKIEKAADGSYTLTGDLTLLGKSKAITVKLNEVPKDANDKNANRKGADGVFTFKRSDFGMNYGLDNGALGDEVEVIVGLGAEKK